MMKVEFFYIFFYPTYDLTKWQSKRFISLTTWYSKRKTPEDCGFPLGGTSLLHSSTVIAPNHSAFSVSLASSQGFGIIREFSISFGRQVIHRSKSANRTACGPSCLSYNYISKRVTVFEVYRQSATHALILIRPLRYWAVCTFQLSLVFIFKQPRSLPRTIEARSHYVEVKGLQLPDYSTRLCDSMFISLVSLANACVRLLCLYYIKIRAKLLKEMMDSV